MFVEKSGVNEYRFVNDLRAVNKLTKPIYWPLPTLEDIVDTVSGNFPVIFFLHRHEGRVFSDSNE